MKEKILDIAIKQMRSGGYENLNFAEIAEELGTSRANLHHHFKNKEGLATAATEIYINQYTKVLDKLIDSNDGNIHQILRGLEDHLSEFFIGDSTCSGCILSQLLNDHEAPANLRQLALYRLKAELKAIRDQIEKSKINGTLINSEDSERLSFRIMAMMLGIPQMAQLGVNLDQIRANIKGSLVSMIK